MNASLGAEDGLQLLYIFMVLDRSRYESASIGKAARASSEQVSSLLIMHKLGIVLDKGKGKGQGQTKARLARPDHILALALAFPSVQHNAEFVMSCFTYRSCFVPFMAQFPFSNHPKC